MRSTPISQFGARVIWLRRVAAFLAITAVTMVAQTSGQAQGGDALPFAKSYTITGNYVVGSVDLPAKGTNGSVTGKIYMNGVPDNAEILAAFLYWETISAELPGQDFDYQPKFRGQPITVVKKSSQELSGTLAGCWNPAPAPMVAKLNMYRADVMKLLPDQKDVDNQPTGNKLVNDWDLVKYGYPLHSVTLPQASGVNAANQFPQTAGASLFVVYRDPTQRLTKIVLNEGAFVQKSGVPMTETIRGFIQSSTNPAAKMTHIVSSRWRNPSERLKFGKGLTGALSILATNPFRKYGDDDDDDDDWDPPKGRGWSTKTYNVSSLMPGIDANDGFGETVRTQVDHGSPLPQDCLAWSAIIFSTTVEDSDNDGLIDKMESTPGGLKLPDGTRLPDLKGMGADPLRKDLFVEIGAMKAGSSLTWGSADAPFKSNPDPDLQINVVPIPGSGISSEHNHMPTPAVLKMVGDAYKAAPVTVPGGSPGIKVHFDVGPLGTYRANGNAFSSDVADEYLIGDAFARGGESINEIACFPGKPCRFPEFPGTVSYKAGFQLYRDAPVNNDGTELSLACPARSHRSLHRVRFDRRRLPAPLRREPHGHLPLRVVRARPWSGERAGLDPHRPQRSEKQLWRRRPGRRLTRHTRSVEHHQLRRDGLRSRQHHLPRARPRLRAVAWRRPTATYTEASV